MLWEMATARLVISSGVQILWVVARVQEGKTLLGYQIVAILWFWLLSHSFFLYQACQCCVSTHPKQYLGTEVGWNNLYSNTDIEKIRKISLYSAPFSSD